MSTKAQHAGIDYGSKLAGTTAVAMLQQDSLQVWQSVRGQDADLWLLRLLQELNPIAAFIDAPLSLPHVYSTPVPADAAADYFYRASDREVKAMSPMFIGGLTARAMRLRATLQQDTGIALVETYPSQLVRLCWPEEKAYKKGAKPTAQHMEWLMEQVEVPMAQPQLENWHQFDAVLAWHSGQRFYTGKTKVYGTAAEGQIVI